MLSNMLELLAAQMHKNRLDELENYGMWRQAKPGSLRGAVG